MLRALLPLLLCSLLSPPALATALPLTANGVVLRIQGSNTIGAALGPALAKGLMEEQGLLKVRSEPRDNVNEQRLVGQTAQGQPVIIDIAAHGSSTGFSGLLPPVPSLNAVTTPRAVRGPRGTATWSPTASAIPSGSA